MTRDDGSVKVPSVLAVLKGCPEAYTCQTEIAKLQVRATYCSDGRGIPQRPCSICIRGLDLLTTPHAEIGPAWLTGLIKPLPAVVFPLQEAADALRQLSAAKHIGKVVVRVPCQLPAPEEAPAGSWIISGGLGALGSLSVQWLASQGAQLCLCTICYQDLHGWG